MTYTAKHAEKVTEDVPVGVLEILPLRQLDIGELTGHNLEVRGREEVNRLLQAGWRLLHIYTLKYEEDGVWRERPMAILGRLSSRRGRCIGKGSQPLAPASRVMLVAEGKL